MLIDDADEMYKQIKKLQRIQDDLVEKPVPKTARTIMVGHPYVRKACFTCLGSGWIGNKGCEKCQGVGYTL